MTAVGEAASRSCRSVRSSPVRSSADRVTDALNGRYVALSRWDREANAIVTSHDLTVWDDPVSLPRPTEPWDLVPLGNCGSPIETPAG